MRKIILFVCCLISIPFLQGCVAGAVVAGGAAGAAVAADHRSFRTMAGDQKIIHNIREKIRADDELLKDTHIVVVSYNRVVLLAGQATTPELSAKAEELAHSVPEVRRVFNQITIEPPTSGGQRSKDTAITANVKARLISTTNVSARQIKVVTENGTVFLMGVTTREQAAAAAQVAKNSTGVQRVVKLIEYINAN